jgi:hypothetical protein
MKPATNSFSLATVGLAVVNQAGACYFSLTATGGPSGLSGRLGQLSDGQNRIGDSSLANGSFLLGPNGGKIDFPCPLPICRLMLDPLGITDAHKRGCILTPPTTQFQCDEGANPTPGFSIGCDGTLTSSGNPGFSACPTESNGGYNIYTTVPANQQGCVQIVLTADTCSSDCPSASIVPQPSVPSPPMTQFACPADLTGTWEVSIAF